MKKTFAWAVFIFIFTFLVYLWVAGQFQWKLKKTNFAYFNFLAESFLKKSWFLINPPANRYDLSVYQGRVYLYWGPLPAIIILPLIALFGPQASDLVYTAFFGALNVCLFFLLLCQFKKLIKNKLKSKEIVLLTLFFGFGTVHFSISVVGRVWFTSQIISLTFSLFSLIFLFKFLSSKKFAYFFLSMGFLLTAASSRLTYLLFLPMFFYALFKLKLAKKRTLKNMFFSLGLIIVFSLLYFFYNYERFGNIWEIGYHYQQEHSDFAALKNKYGRYHLRYLLTNIKYQLLNPLAFKNKFPFVSPNLKGNGLFIISPLFLLLLWQIKKLLKDKYSQLFLLGIAPVFFQLMFFYGTGEAQFGARYLLDIVPFLILILSQQISFVPKPIKYPLLLASVFICSLGAVWFAAYRQW